MKLTEAQELAVKGAIGDGSDWPDITTDPLVNHRVDQLVMNELNVPDLVRVPDWELLEENERQCYIEAAIAWSMDSALE